MKAVGHLHRLGRAAARTVSIGTGAIAGDQLDAGVQAQPAGERLRLTIGQQRQWPATLQIDQHGAISVALAQGPVVDPEHRGRDVGRQGSGPDQPQQRVARGRYE
jgi:hypothetical protein